MRLPYFHAEGVIARSGLCPTCMPTVMLTRRRLNMADLPAYDRARAFRLLVALVALVDRDVDRRAAAAAAAPADAPGVRKLSTHRAVHRIGAGQQRAIGHETPVPSRLCRHVTRRRQSAVR
ncbi:hypothetical protein ACWCQW_39905 [Streptomyces mirabilis]